MDWNKPKILQKLLFRNKKFDEFLWSRRKRALPGIVPAKGDTNDGEINEEINAIIAYGVHAKTKLTKE